MISAENPRNAFRRSCPNTAVGQRRGLMSSDAFLKPSAERPLGTGAIALILLLCVSWGFNQIAVKLALPDIPPLLQATIRSAGALPVLLLIARLRGVKLFASDGTLAAGIFAGLMFGFE